MASLIMSSEDVFGSSSPGAKKAVAVLRMNVFDQRWVHRGYGFLWTRGLLTSVHLLNYRLMIAVLSLSSGDLIRDLSSLSEIPWTSVLVHLEAHSPVCNSYSVFTYGILTSRCSLGQIESLVLPFFDQGCAFRLHGRWEGIHYCQHFLT